MQVDTRPGRGCKRSSLPFEVVARRMRPPQMLAESLVSKFEAYFNLAVLVSNQNDFAQLDGDGYS
jgi:hypothetical protein